MNVDKGQFDAALSKMLKAEPIKRDEIKKGRKKTAKVIQPKPSR
ncbi:MAG TPA: hypothetical protein VD837_13175 [Terriglobales bacterium]|nr:hypothetical protein [Terriglobales bacterium]